MDAHEEKAAAVRILKYLQANPEAKDTLEGIAEWWLLRQRITETVEMVSQAVRWLVAQGFIVESKLPGDRTIYEINPKNKKRITRFLAQNQ